MRELAANGKDREWGGVCWQHACAMQTNMVPLNFFIHCCAYGMVHLEGGRSKNMLTNARHFRSGQCSLCRCRQVRFRHGNPVEPLHRSQLTNHQRPKTLTLSTKIRPPAYTGWPKMLFNPPKYQQSLHQ